MARSQGWYAGKNLGGRAVFIGANGERVNTHKEALVFYVKEEAEAAADKYYKECKKEGKLNPWDVFQVMPAYLWDCDDCNNRCVSK